VGSGRLRGYKSLGTQIAVTRVGHGQRTGNFCNAQGNLCNESGPAGVPGGDCHDRQPPPVPAVRMGADRPSLCFTLRIRGFWRGHFGLTIGAAATMAGLSTLAPRLGGELRVLRKAALLIWNALAAFTACDSG
jgi:hypothetical protein